MTGIFSPAQLGECGGELAPTAPVDQYAKSPEFLQGFFVCLYYYAGSTRVAMRQGSVVSYLHADHLGSASLTTNESGNPTSQLRYLPYGAPRPGYPTGSVPTDLRFTGQRSEEASLGSLYDYGARFYSPVLGRFLSADTIVPSPGNPQTLNRYAYTRNNPIKYNDPTGHDVGCGGKDCSENPPPLPPPPPQEQPVPTPIPIPTESPTQRARVALQQVKEWCQQATPSCYSEQKWWLVDPLYGWPPDMIDRMEAQSLKAYRKQGLELDQVVAQNKNNPLKVDSRYMPASEYGDLIQVMASYTRRSAVMAQFLTNIGLKSEYEENREPLFLLGHIENNRLVLYRTVQWCMANSEGCWTIGLPAEQ